MFVDLHVVVAGDLMRHGDEMIRPVDLVMAQPGDLTAAQPAKQDQQEHGIHQRPCSCTQSRKIPACCGVQTMTGLGLTRCACHICTAGAVHTRALVSVRELELVGSQGDEGRV